MLLNTHNTVSNVDSDSFVLRGPRNRRNSYGNNTFTKKSKKHGSSTISDQSDGKKHRSNNLYNTNKMNRLMHLYSSVISSSNKNTNKQSNEVNTQELMTLVYDSVVKPSNDES